MPITRKQGIAMAATVLAGVIAAGAVLVTDKHGSGGRHAAHTEHAEHADGHATAKGAAASEDPGKRHIKLNDAQASAAGITVQAAGPASVQAVARFQGEIHFDEDRTAHVVPRFSGVALSVDAALGQQVGKGQVLAVIASTQLAEQRSELLTAQRRRDAARVTYQREKALWDDRISAQQDVLQAQTALQEADIAVDNAAQKLAAVGAPAAASSLNRFEIRAPLAGTVVEKHLSQGEAVKEDASIFTVSDLRAVTAEFAVAPQDLATVRVGQRVSVSSTAFDGKAEGRIAYVGALLGEQTRTARARVPLTNPGGAWRPGLHVTVTVLGDDRAVPVAVSADALQTIGNDTVVFKAEPGGFVATPVKVGRSDGRTVEVVAGLQPGDKVAASGTFVLKSELGKGSAGHGH